MSNRNINERRVVWSPRQDNFFIVSGPAQLTLYEYNSSKAEIKHVVSQTDLQAMKCFAWSPHSAFKDLVAVGMSTGKVEMIKLDATRYSKNNQLSNSSVLSLPVRSPRSCTALSFCQSKPSLLAVGLDKVKGEPSLIVWDLESPSPVTIMDATLPKDADFKVAYTRPLHRYPTPRVEAKIVQQYASQEIASAVAFLAGSTDRIVAGLSGRWLRLFDIRIPQNMHAQIPIPSKVQNIATDPFDQHRLACVGDQGIVTVWDTRTHMQPLLTFTSQDAAADGARYHKNESFAGIEFSNNRRGLLATLEKDSNYVRFWDIQQAQISQSLKFDVPKDTSRSVRKSWSSPSTMLAWTASTDQLSPPDDTSCSNILSNTYRTKYFSRPLVSFALSPSAKSSNLILSKLVAINGAGDIEMHEVHDTPKSPVWNSRGSLSIGVGVTCEIYSGNDHIVACEPWDIDFVSNTTDLKIAPVRSEENLMMNRVNDIVGRDKDLIPASKTTRRESSLTATRHVHGRTYSPASIRRYPLDRQGEYVVTREDAGQEAIKDDSKTISKQYHTYSELRSIDQPAVLQEDISIVMMTRVSLGYGLTSLSHNEKVSVQIKDNMSALPEIWSWFDSTRNLLLNINSVENEFDFAFQGIFGIWQGSAIVPDTKFFLQVPTSLDDFDSSSILNNADADVERRERSLARNRSPGVATSSNYAQAVNMLLSRLDNEKAEWKPVVDTSKLSIRRLANALCGWSAGDEQISFWEKSGNYSQAACWLLFTNQQSKALECLMRSKDEAHHLMSGALAGLIMSHTTSLSRNNALREHCDRLLVKIQDPYFRIMISYLVVGDWAEILDEEYLPLRERISIALRFLDDKAFSIYLRQTVEYCREKGSIEGLILTGLTQQGFDILQSYVDRTGDIQTAAILSCYVSPVKFWDARAQRWLDAYRDLLDCWQLFHHRCQFDIERGEILRDAIDMNEIAEYEWVPRDFLIRCTYCNKVVNSQPSTTNKSGFNNRTTACPYCGRGLPRCSVCLRNVGIVSDAIRENDLLRSVSRDTIDEAFLYCQSCRHGGHAAHILQWFRLSDENETRRKTCAIADCDCLCNINV